MEPVENPSPWDWGEDAECPPPMVLHDDAVSVRWSASASERHPSLGYYELTLPPVYSAEELMQALAYVPQDASAVTIENTMGVRIIEFMSPTPPNIPIGDGDDR